ncbi:hypothetical protein ASPZODRAFT_17133 [Penicilliopsis zonata CBS 506.65]|uniref:HNH nuclease domain-containing protein n=1 Tax=Penicilliopsis zonata CBS 506.65 TaxID=1073090 RepID=A0A1L9SF88_9EURO|nr:hypothetical protein ASPZODRAFT_17133 [Penicilliopsis zonata CBS 506.65]OJJ45684.1 hypothetical protein ASPZODRAFT_17133 [Penicilliopsis zonata CBS 506.65]
MIKRKQPLRGAAKTAHEAKIARLAGDGHDPITTELDALAAAGAATYGTLDEAIARAKAYHQQNEQDHTTAILLGCLDGFTGECQENLIRDVLGRDDEGLQILAQGINEYIFFRLKATGARTPTASEFSSSCGNEPDLGRNIKIGTDQGKLKATCLSRDNTRCLITGMYDADEAQQLSAEDDRRKSWAFLYRYFPRLEEIVDVRCAGAINTPRNAMTMASFLHTEFGKSLLALQATGVENQYRLKTFPRFPRGLNTFLPASRMVQFYSHNWIDVPDPLLLEIHLTISNILHATGMGRIIDLTLEEMEASGVDPLGCWELESRIGQWLCGCAEFLAQGCNNP